MASEAPSDSSEAGGEPSGAALPDSSAGASSELGGSARLLHSPSGSFGPLLWAGRREKGKGKGRRRSEGESSLFLDGFPGFQRATPKPKTVSGTACSLFIPAVGGSNPDLSPTTAFIQDSLQCAQHRSPKEPVALEGARSHRGCVNPYRTPRSSKDRECLFPIAIISISKHCPETPNHCSFPSEQPQAGALQPWAGCCTDTAKPAPAPGAFWGTSPRGHFGVFPTMSDAADTRIWEQTLLWLSPSQHLGWSDV